MASCQALYGVTMEEEGVSKLIPVRISKRLWVDQVRGVMRLLLRWLANALLKKQKQLAWKKLHLTALDMHITDVSRPWPMPLVKQACSFKQIG